MNAPTTTIDKVFLERALTTVFAEWVRALDLRVLEARAGEVLLALPVSAKHVHSGGVMSGQTLMAVVDTAMVFVVMFCFGEF